MAAAGSAVRKPGSPRDSESELWSRRVREVVSTGPGNRFCFECGERGVTYVDITLGTFVCTGCSGALRGLNPPHRVKSISMTTFTEAEVQFLQSRGNEICRKVWLGSFDPRTSLLPDSRDSQKVKEFLQDKYEKKRWYVSPEQAKGAATLTHQSTAPEVKPLQKLLGDSVPGQPTSQLHAPKPTKKASTDLLADIGGDPFAAPQPVPSFTAFPAFGGPGQAHATFANFDAFGASPVASAFGGTPAPSQSPFQSQPIVAASRTLPGGYSFIGGTHASSFPASPASQSGVGALEVGGVFGAGAVPGSVFAQLSHSPALPPPPRPASAYAAYTNPFTAPAASQPPLPSTNPFQTNGLAPGVFAVGSPGGFSASPVPGVFPSPFQQPLFPSHTALGQQQNDPSFSAFPTAKSGQRPLSISTNPFVTPAVPSAPFTGKHPSTNPFL